MTPAGDSPYLSVIIAAYNAVGSIRVAVASVLDARVDLECLVVDDGSTDATSEVVAELAAGDPRVRLLVQAQNAGVSAARNRALDEARGEWLAFVDADDRMLPGGLEALVAGSRLPGVRMVRGQQVATDGRSRWRVGAHLHPHLRAPGRKSVLTHPGLLNNQGPPGKLYHRSLAEGLRFEGRMMGDGPWVCRATIRAGGDVLVIADDVYEYRRPSPGNEFSTITAERQRSARLAVAGISMAEKGWREVAAALADAAQAAGLPPAARHALDVFYLERVVRADVAGMFTAALVRRDPECRQIVTALAAFLRALPPDVVADTRAVGDRLVRPGIGLWNRLPVDARPAFADLLAASRPARDAGRRGLPASWILRNPGVALLADGGSGRVLRTTLGLLVAWPHAAASLALERAGRLAGSPAGQTRAMRTG